MGHDVPGVRNQKEFSQKKSIRKTKYMLAYKRSITFKGEPVGGPQTRSEPPNPRAWREREVWFIVARMLALVCVKSASTV